MNITGKTYEEKIRQLILPILEQEGMELVDLECLWMKTRWLVRLYIDKEGGITIDDCTAISNQAGDILDIHNVPLERYNLEVSSPGLDRPLVRDKDFVNYRGSKVRLKLESPVDGSRNICGELVDYLEEDGGKYLVVTTAGKMTRIPRSLVKKANVVYDF